MYKYLITYYGDPLAIADSDEQADNVIKQHQRDVKSDLEGYSIDAVRYIPDKETKDGTED